MSRLLEKYEEDITISHDKYVNEEINELHFQMDAIEDVTFENCRLHQVVFRDLCLEKVHFNNCELMNCYFMNTNLKEVGFENSKLTDVVFDEGKANKIYIKESLLQFTTFAKMKIYLGKFDSRFVDCSFDFLELNESDFGKSFFQDFRVNRLMCSKVSFYNAIIENFVGDITSFKGAILSMEQVFSLVQGMGIHIKELGE